MFWRREDTLIDLREIAKYEIRKHDIHGNKLESDKYEVWGFYRASITHHDILFQGDYAACVKFIESMDFGVEILV